MASSARGTAQIDVRIGSVPVSDRPHAAAAAAGTGGARWMWAAAVAVAAFAGICATTSRLFLADTYMSLYAGRYLSAHGIPSHDPFTVAAHGRLWVDQQWLAQRLYYGAWQIGGTPAVGLLSALAIAVAFGMLAAIMLGRGVDPLRTATWCTIAFFVCQVNTVIRAQSFAYPLFVGLLWMLLNDERRGRWDPRLLWVVGLIAVWANVHGSALLGAALACAWFGVRAVIVFRRGLPRHVAAYLLTAAATAAAVLATPYSPRDVLTYYRSVLANPVLARYITEWFPATFGGVSTIFVIMLALVLVVTGVAIGRRVSLPKSLLALTAVAGLAGTQTVRYQVWFAFPAALLMAALMQGIAPDSPAAGPVRMPSAVLRAAPAVLLVLAAGLAFAPGQAVRAEIFCLFAGLIAAVDIVRRIPAGDRRRRALALPVPLGLATVAALAALWATPASRVEKFTPLRALAAADTYATAHPRVRILADDASAPALLWHYPALTGRLAFDARLEIFPRSVLLGYMHWVTMDSGNWQAAERGYGMLVVSAVKNPELANRLAHLRGWRVLFRDSSGIVDVRA
jgi:hypothetical protein